MTQAEQKLIHALEKLSYIPTEDEIAAKQAERPTCEQPKMCVTWGCYFAFPDQCRKTRKKNND